MSNLFYFTAGTMIGSLVAFFVFSIFYVGRRREKERECEEDRLLRSVVNKQDRLIATLEEALYMAATYYLGKIDDCRMCCFGYKCKVHNQDDVDVCIETVIEGWKDGARRIVE